MKLCDFGLSKIISDRTWTLCGTAEYVAPEMISGNGHGLSVDWWSLGIMTYEMIRGVAPFSADTAYDTYRMIARSKLTFDSSFSRMPKCRSFVQGLLQRDRRKRLGCGKGGVKGLKKHKWLSGIDWSAVLNAQAQVPYTMDVKGDDDTSFFKDYPESDEDKTLPLNGEEREQFNVFYNF